MKQVFIAGHGGPDKLQLRESPDPRPAGGELRIRVQASGVERALRPLGTLGKGGPGPTRGRASPQAGRPRAQRSYRPYGTARFLRPPAGTEVPGYSPAAPPGQRQPPPNRLTKWP